MLCVVLTVMIVVGAVITSADPAHAEKRCGFNLIGASPTGTYVSVSTATAMTCAAAKRAVRRGDPRLRFGEGTGSLKVTGWRCRLAQFSGGVDYTYRFVCRDGRRSFTANGRP